MTAKTLSELISQLYETYRQRFSIEIQRSHLLNKKKKIISGKEKEEGTLRDQIKVLDDKVNQILDEWTREQVEGAKQPASLLPSQPLVFKPQIAIDFSVVKDAFPIETRLHSGRLNVPEGQVFVFGNAGADESGFSEVYLGGETILPRRKDKKSLVAVLAETPGEINCVANQWLAGISVSKENVAKISIKIPVFLHDPIQVLKKSGGDWVDEDRRKKINNGLSEQINHRLQEILTDRIQFWSGEPREILDRVCTMLNRDLGEWGLQVKAGSVSIIRQLPQMLYEIVSQFSMAEQATLESLDIGQRALVVDQTSLADADLTFIEATSRRENSLRGEGLFLILRDKMPALESKPEAFIKILNWLRIHGGASAANYAVEITKLYGRTSQGDFDAKTEPGVSDIQLSQQVLLSAFRNPLIGLGEMLEKRN